MGWGGKGVAHVHEEGEGGEREREMGSWGGGVGEIMTSSGVLGLIWICGSGQPPLGSSEQNKN